jgi:hypothetical protein
MRTGMHPSPSSPPLAAAGPREGSATRLSPIEGDGRQLSVPRLSGGGGSGSRNGVASTLRARLDQQLAIRMDQTWASGPDALGSPTFSPSADERAEELSILKKELAESYSAIAGESYLCLSLPPWSQLRGKLDLCLGKFSNFLESKYTPLKIYPKKRSNLPQSSLQGGFGLANLVSPGALPLQS